MPLLSMASQMPVLAGILLVLRGTAGLRLAAFPLLFLAFMMPLPGMVVEAMTGQLKELLSAASVDLLHALGYPAARSGVVIVVGQYQLLMADACSGLHSLFSLAALGLLYVHLTARRDESKTGGTGGGQGDGYRGAHVALLLAAILPVALAANLLRVVLLILVTYHGGDALGRQIHEAMGVLVFLVALALLFAVDGALLALARRPAAGAQP
jgi:exosortase/archaeosortase family protein